MDYDRIPLRYYENILKFIRSTQKLGDEDYETLRNLPSTHKPYWYQWVVRQCSEHKHLTKSKYVFQLIAEHIRNEGKSTLLWDPKDTQGFIKYLYPGQDEKQRKIVSTLGNGVITNYIIRYNDLAFLSGNHKRFIRQEMEQNQKMLKSRL